MFLELPVEPVETDDNYDDVDDHEICEYRDNIDEDLLCCSEVVHVDTAQA